MYNACCYIVHCTISPWICHQASHSGNLNGLGLSWSIESSYSLSAPNSDHHPLTPYSLPTPLLHSVSLWHLSAEITAQIANMVNTRVIYLHTYVTILLTPSSALLGVILAPNQEVFATFAGLKIRNSRKSIRGIFTKRFKKLTFRTWSQVLTFKTWFKI